MNSITIVFDVLVGVRLPFRVGLCSEFTLGSVLASRSFFEDQGQMCVAVESR